MKQSQTIWKTIPGHKNYEASNDGRIRSKTFFTKHPTGSKKIVRGRILKQNLCSKGYLSVSLGQNKSRLVHRLVALTFIPNTDKKPCVNHHDGNKTNNNVSNLSWCTYSENEKHSYRCLGKLPNKTGLGKFGQLNGFSKPVALLDLKGRINFVFGSAAEASRETGATKVTTVCRGKQNSSKGLRFKYLSKQQYRKHLQRQNSWNIIGPQSAKDYKYTLVHD